MRGDITCMQQNFLTEIGYCHYISTLNFPNEQLGKKYHRLASIIVSRTCKLRFTSNSISRSGTGLGKRLPVQEDFEPNI